jgi:hypothetical protein
MLLAWIPVVGCATGHHARRTIDPAGPALRVRVRSFVAAGEDTGLDEGTLDFLASRVCGVLAETGGDRLSCLTDSDFSQLARRAALQESLGGCAENEEGCGVRSLDVDFDAVVQGRVAREDGRLSLDLVVVDVQVRQRVAEQRAVAKDAEALYEAAEGAARELAYDLLGAK